MRADTCAGDINEIANCTPKVDVHTEDGVTVEFWSVIVPEPPGLVEAAAPSAVFSRTPSPPEVVTLTPFPVMLPASKA
jgi:hypothetical protein